MGGVSLQSDSTLAEHDKGVGGGPWKPSCSRCQVRGPEKRHDAAGDEDIKVPEAPIHRPRSSPEDN